MMFEEVFEEHARVFERFRSSQMAVIESAAALAAASLTAGGKILIFGNGGSAADAQHFAAELVGRFEKNRPGLAAAALTVNTSTLTAVGNDYGFERIFARQIEALADADDTVIAISTSGNSANVLAAVIAARAIGCRVVGLTGEGGGAVAEHCDALIAVPSKTVARIQEMHEIVLHALAGWLERNVVGNREEGAST